MSLRKSFESEYLARLYQRWPREPNIPESLHPGCRPSYLRPSRSRAVSTLPSRSVTTHLLVLLIYQDGRYISSNENRNGSVVLWIEVCKTYKYMLSVVDYKLYTRYIIGLFKCKRTKLKLLNKLKNMGIAGMLLHCYFMYISFFRFSFRAK